MNVPSQQEVTDALLAMLNAGLPNGVDAGDHRAPEPIAYPYVILYAVPGGRYTGPPLVAPYSDAWFVYQISSVGERRDQAQRTADTVRNLMVGHDLTTGALATALNLPAGWRVCARLQEATPPGVEPEGEPPNQVFTVPEQFTIVVTPA